MSKIENAENVSLFALNANQPLAQAVADQVGIPLSKCTISHFADGEISVTIDESVRGREVYVIQSISEPVNTNLMELLIMVDALRRASAKKINVVVPYYGYARQDRKARSREPITAKLVANLLTMDQIDRMIVVDLHAPQVQGFFDIPVDHLLAAPTLVKYFMDEGITDNLVIVAPDHAGVNRVRRFAELIGGAPIAIVDKRTESNREARHEQLPTTVVDTGSRIANSATLLKKCGADRVFGVATHAVLSGDASQRLLDSPLEKMVVTDTIVIPEEKQTENIEQLSVAPLLAGAINRIHNHLSIHDLFQLPEEG